MEVIECMSKESISTEALAGTVLEDVEKNVEPDIRLDVELGIELEVEFSAKFNKVKVIISTNMSMMNHSKTNMSMTWMRL